MTKESGTCDATNRRHEIIWHVVGKAHDGLASGNANDTRARHASLSYSVGGRNGSRLEFGLHRHGGVDYELLRQTKARGQHCNIGAGLLMISGVLGLIWCEGWRFVHVYSRHAGSRGHRCESS